ncbi:Tumor necrosis factor ligand superfamily member 10 [Varanus komodoensis]|nr:Tumor necrosis factor ligand superfamily member 10 [Varanus komodoensis]
MAQAAAPAGQQYFRSDSSDSAARMLGPAEGEAPACGEKRRRRKRCSPVWLAVAAMAIVALQVASTTGLFVYFTMSIAKLKSQAQGSSEELRCLLFLNRLQELPDSEELVGSHSCLKLAGSIKDYIDMVTEGILRKSTQSASARPFGELQRSCQHPLPHWASRTMHTHLQNITYRDGMLQVRQAGRYYVYTQIYFRYPAEGADPRAAGHQLVQCVNRQSASGQNILLLKGVGTKCWAQDATYGLHALYQGGLFELRAGDKLFVSVSSLDINYDHTGSYFGAFRLDV